MPRMQVIQKREQSIIARLQEKRSGVDDRTGKGAATERLIDQELITPHLPPRFRSAKGSVVTSEDPDKQSVAIDRVIYDASAASPLLYDESHSIFPVEIMCGLVEITLNLDARKLRTDIERLAPLKAMTKRRYLVPITNSRTQRAQVTVETVSPRAFLIGLPDDPNWSPKAIANALREIQLQLGPPMHIHGLYVLGVGFFKTISVESKAEQMYRIAAWTGPERLFRFTDSFRRSFDRWNALEAGWSVDLSGYVAGDRLVFTE